MPAAAIAFTTPAGSARWKRRLLLSPIARIVIFALLLAAIGALVAWGFGAIGWTARGTSPLHRAVASTVTELAATVAAYLIVVHALERRRACELALRDVATFGAAGFLGGLVLFSTIALALWLAGSYHVTGTNAHIDWAFGVLAAGVGAGIGEEIVTRGVLFRMVEEGLGTWWALALSAAFFGAMHLANPGATLWSSVAIMIEAGLLLALVYHVTRSLWACVGLHAAWNIAEGAIYGISVSGNAAHGWLRSTLTGPAWLSGGKFGAEASVVAIGVCLVPTAVLMAIALRRQSIVRPYWRRHRGPALMPVAIPSRH